MFRNVVAALNEALDITMHLKPLTEHFKVLELISENTSNLISWSDPGGKWFHGRETTVPPDDAHGLPGVLPLPVFQLCCPDHRLDDCKLWSFNILQLNSPRQLQEVCNLLIGMARSYLDPVSIFQIEVNYKLCLSWKTIQEISLYSGWGGSWES